MATHSSILAWRIPWTEEPVGYSPGVLKESDMTEATLHACIRTRVILISKKTQSHLWVGSKC